MDRASDRVRRFLIAIGAPSMLAIAPIVSLYSRNHAELTLHVIWLPGGLAMLAAIATALLVNLRRADAARACTFTSLLALAFWCYGPIQDALGTVMTLSSVRHRIFLPLYIALWATAAFWSLRSTRAAAVAGPLTVMGGMLVALAAFRPLLAASGSGTRNGPAVLSPVHAVQMPNQPPDIYWFVLDSYPSEVTLVTRYRVARPSLFEGLIQRGFVVTPASTSNYPSTTASIPSTLNMAYWHLSGHRVDRDLRRGIDESSVVRSLQRAGYRWIDLARLREAFALDFNNALLTSSILRPAWISLRSRPPFANVNKRRAQILAPFDTLAAIARDSVPTLTYLHVMAAHAPFVFSATGELLAAEATSGESSDPAIHRRLLVEQLRFLDAKILAALDSVLHNSSVRPIIVVQADHGPAPVNVFRDPSPRTLAERFSILNAYLLPSTGTGARLNPPDDISPVNTFRLILTSYFGVDSLPPLPNRNYFEDWYRASGWHDVTSSVSLELQSWRSCATPCSSAR